ncbi:unnamed protein product [Paramecium pentaurelia]|uniref:Uncharacterized protein n=1 Tax=Paramecium pentaurelia TaxID=43138 RepID=A0A8S1YGY7_9CILI|nr:unnamed protein product [Paramecium pentaurelia]
MNSQDDYNFQGSYNIIAKNICVGCQMEQQVQKLQIQKELTLEVFLTFTSTKTKKKIYQANLFNDIKSKTHYLQKEDQNYLIECLEQFEENLINQFCQKQKPLKEIVSILNTTE